MRAWSLVPLALLLGCGPSMQAGAGESAVTLDVEPETVAPGDSVVLTLRNGSDGEVGYNLCASSLERAVDGGWQPVPVDYVCTMELRLLPPGESATFSTAIPAGAAAGEYRYTTALELMDSGARTALGSNEFTVRD